MRIAVTGAAGQLGGQVVKLLTAQDADVVAVARRPPDQPPPPRVSFVLADYEDPGSLRGAFGGVGTLVFVSSDGETVNVLRHHQHVIQAAADAGVGHVVALSGLDADVTSPFCYAVTYGHTERLLRDSGCGFSIARASIFTEFFLRFVTPARTSGEIRLPAADGRVSLVSQADVGRSLAALALGDPTGAVHELTGPAALSLDEIAGLATRRWHTPVGYSPLTSASFQVDLAREGTLAWWNYAFATMFASIREHRWERVTDDVLQLTGRPPQSLSDLLPSPTPPG
jgi:NAD(P)H dehydrogenase (quinone)